MTLESFTIITPLEDLSPELLKLGTNIERLAHQLNFPLTWLLVSDNPSREAIEELLKELAIAITVIHPPAFGERLGLGKATVRGIEQRKSTNFITLLVGSDFNPDLLATNLMGGDPLKFNPENL